MRRAEMRRQLLAAATLYNTPPEPTPPAPSGGGGTPVPTPAELAARTGQQSTPPPTPGQPDPGNTGEPVLTYTQRHLSHLLAKEKKQGATATLRTLAEAAGLDAENITDEQLKTFITDAKTARDAALTEEQRRAADLEAREAALAAKEAAAATAAATAQTVLREAKQQAALARAGVDPGDLDVAQAFLSRTVADDADDAALLTAVEALKASKPKLFTSTVVPGMPPAPGGAPAGGPPNRTSGSVVKAGDRGRARAQAMGLA
ncbi:hypothetical protein [Kitasatospora sp. NPDC087315]|uniref:hypothetical protein n=1 Tax=Kitasatospora sp. NPDC087315 TaxID=3364069 RepID=UPI0037FCA9A9